MDQEMVLMRKRLIMVCLAEQRSAVSDVAYVASMALVCVALNISLMLKLAEVELFHLVIQEFLLCMADTPLRTVAGREDDIPLRLVRSTGEPPGYMPYL